VRTTDNSFLKILVEQGVLGLALFAAGMVAAVVLLARRIRRVPSESRPLGFAALAGFVSFLGLSISGESVEQPGKVVAWGLLGIAAAVAFTPAHEELA
jgi:O-antigen ligase